MLIFISNINSYSVIYFVLLFCLNLILGSVIIFTIPRHPLCYRIHLRHNPTVSPWKHQKGTFCPLSQFSEKNCTYLWCWSVEILVLCINHFVVVSSLPVTMCTWRWSLLVSTLIGSWFASCFLSLCTCALVYGSILGWYCLLNHGFWLFPLFIFHILGVFILFLIRP